MNQRFLSLCGVLAPLLFVFMTLLGAAIRPGYSHLADTVSELFSPGSPNKPLLDTLHTIFAALLTLFGVGILQFVRRSRGSSRIGIIGASLYIAAGLVSVATATIYPQDPWGSPPTFPGQMHMTLTGVVALLSMLSITHHLLRITLHASRITFQAPFITRYSLLITHHASRFTFYSSTLPPTPRQKPPPPITPLTTTPNIAYNCICNHSQ